MRPARRDPVFFDYKLLVTSCDRMQDRKRTKALGVAAISCDGPVAFDWANASDRHVLTPADQSGGKLSSALPESTPQVLRAASVRSRTGQSTSTYSSHTPRPCPVHPFECTNIRKISRRFVPTFALPKKEPTSAVPSLRRCHNSLREGPAWGHPPGAVTPGFGVSGGSFPGCQSGTARVGAAALGCPAERGSAVVPPRSLRLFSAPSAF